MTPDATLVYDGDCGFCTRCAAFAERYVRRGENRSVAVVAWQVADLDGLGLTASECAEAVQWVGGDGVRGAGPVAIAHLLGAGGPGGRLAGWLLARRPVLALAWPVYRWVARNRHRLPGGSRACALPRDTSPSGPATPVTGAGV
jgi:predicted DCC family thiol-disulfide oxidoreductase YuxK